MRSRGLACAILVLVVATVHADGVATVRTMGGNGVGARAMGMGGAYTAIVDGPQALYWNPAALAQERDFKTDATLVGSAHNADIVVDIGDVYNAVGDETINAGNFNDLWQAAGRASGRPVKAEVGGLVGLSYRQFALGANGQAAGEMLLERQPGGTGAFDPLQSAAVTGTASGLAYWAAAVGYGHMLRDDLAVGAALKRVRVVRAAADVSAHYDAGTLSYSSATHSATSDGDEAYTADLGILWWPEAEKYGRRVRVGAMVRNITSPKFDVDLPLDTVRRVTFEPTVNVGLGVTSQDGRTTFAADVHNMLGANDTDGVFGVGVEHQFAKWLAARIGLRDGDWTGGLTLAVGPFGLTAAFGAKWDEMLGFSFSTEF